MSGEQQTLLGTEPAAPAEPTTTPAEQPAAEKPVEQQAAGEATAEAPKPVEQGVQAEAKKDTPPLEVKLPEGVEADAELTEALKAPKTAQDAINAVFAYQERLAAQHESKREQQITDWRKAVEADKEIGGEGLKTNLAAAQKAITKFGTPELAKLFRDTSAGDHPEMVRLLVRVGKALGEDSVAGTTTAPNGANGVDHRAAWYPNSNMNP